MRRQTLGALLLLFSAAGVSMADSIVGNFDLDSGLNPVASQGQITFTLNGDGSIAASLIAFGNNIAGFGFNSATANLPESGFSPTAPDNAQGWFDAFGSQLSGFACSSCGLTESWTIDGSYASVFDVLNGGALSSVDFFLFDSNGEFGAQVQLSSVPEPSSLILVSSVLLAFIARKRIVPRL